MILGTTLYRKKTSICGCMVLGYKEPHCTAQTAIYGCMVLGTALYNTNNHKWVYGTRVKIKPPYVGDVVTIRQTVITFLWYFLVPNWILVRLRAQFSFSKLPRCEIFRLYSPCLSRLDVQSTTLGVSREGCIHRCFHFVNVQTANTSR